MGINSRDNSIRGEHVIELISSYIDNALEPAEHERVRAHIATCEVCGAELRELQATQQMLRALPVQVPPRAFTLTEEMVGAKSRAEGSSLLSRLFGGALAPRLATGSVLAFTLLLVVLVSDLGLRSQNMAAPAITTSAKFAPGSEGNSPEATQLFSANEPTSTTAAAAMMPALAPTTDSVMPATGGGEAGPTATTPSLSNPAPPEATALAETNMATATSGMEAPTEGQAARVPTAQEAAGDQASGIEAEGTVLAFNNRNLSPGDESTDEQAPVARSPNPGGTFMPVTLLIELGLAILGVGLAVGALLARRRNA
ncbi:MAG: zf-HC2 domain-containing protein [Chloroflexota bacterium]|nr:zf-HC2 domain-containing protein [Chloroflexota bacterium]